MSNVEKSASEKSYQERFVRELVKYKWETLDELNGNDHKVTVNDLIKHWRKELNRLNADQLEGVPLTDNEFNQVLSKVSRISNSYEAAKLLAIEDSKGKIDGIYRDDNPDITRKQITLTIFKKAEVRGGDSSYRIAREVQTDNGNRFDIILLINGLPLINIEQKRVDKTIDEAYEQFKRYYRDGEYTNNFMAFSQMMVINSEIETRYFATPKSIRDFNPRFVFHWSDKNNKVINDWREVIEHFLMIPMAHQMVGDYLIIDEAKDEENRKHMLMRPYQVYALQAIEGAAFGWDNDDKIAHGGYVWHTTGSGKTITSFKTALFLSTRAGFDNVVFLVDRRELDNRTSENFKAYAKYEAVSVDDTRHTYDLKRKLMSAKNGIIVTTTFKLNALIKEMIEAQDTSLKNKKIVFIIDEAHRTTMGQMMGTIKDYFRTNGLFYGFTGTPLFDENNVKGMINKKSEVINTTEKLFGPLLHQYTIDEAIADRNVLGFHVDYVNTGEFKNYDDLRNQMFNKKKNEHPELSDLDIERQVQKMTRYDLEKQGLFEYQDDTHIPRVVERILKYWDYQSQNKQFNAILTVAYKKRVLAYFKEFKKQLKQSQNKINIAMTFSFGNENDPEPVDDEIVKEMFKDYASFTGIEFIAGDIKHGEEAYFEDIVERTTRGGSGRNSKNIDLVIVADQLLTGYDSKRLNTLYVDRSLELQGLIQAYSRTNRVFDSSKEFGTIINFQYPAITEKMVDEALKLYGSGGKNNKVIVDIYDVAVSKFANLLPEMIELLPEPSNWQILENDDENKDKFCVAFKKANEQMNLLGQYYEYSWNNDTFTLDEHTWLKYIGAYRNLNRTVDPKLPSNPPNKLDRDKIEGTLDITANYIVSLIGAKVITSKGFYIVDAETLRIIYEQIQELSDMGQYEQSELLKEFVNMELVPGNLSSDINFDEAFDLWKANQIENKITKFSNEWGIDSTLLKKSVESYDMYQPEIIPYIDDIINSVDIEKSNKGKSLGFLEHNMQLIEKLPNWIVELKHKFES